MTRISDETRRKVVHAHIQGGHTITSLVAEYGNPEQLFPTRYSRIAKNSKTMMRRSFSWR